MPRASQPSDLTKAVLALAGTLAPAHLRRSKICAPSSSRRSRTSRLRSRSRGPTPLAHAPTPSQSVRVSQGIGGSVTVASSKVGDGASVASAQTSASKRGPKLAKGRSKNRHPDTEDLIS